MRRRFLAATAAFTLAALAVGASDAPAASTSCTGTITDVTITGNLIAGPGCYLNEAVTVNGNVVVRTGGSLDTFDSTINGNVTSHGGTSVSLEYTIVNGNVEIVGSTEGAGVWRSTIRGNLLLKKTSGDFGAEESNVSGNMKVSQNTGDGSASAYFDFDGVGGNFDISNNRGDIVLLEDGAAGNLDIRNNRGDISLTLEHVDGMDIRNNRGAIALAGNTIIGILNCQKNHPSVTVGDENTAGTAKGECAGVPSAAAPAA